MALPALFSERRAAQVAAFFLHHAGGRLPLIKLMKLMYLAERESLRLYGDPIIGDKLVSMPHGPVLSITYGLMQGEPCMPGGWDTWVADREGHDLALADPSMIRTPEQDLLELSETDLEVLTSIWQQYGHMDKWRLRDFTHQGGCPEWEDPGGSSRPIPMSRLLKHLGYSAESAQELIEHLRERERLGKAFQ
ncbi:Panacea domain-containing protein [Allofranklinella schreckenbergeri]|nr:Panacea domain-containing protein [Allofranklinella schreckenbergeri]MDO4705061.1 Panacea domain-containing protein [Comamonadaceae bacterium]